MSKPKTTIGVAVALILAVSALSWHHEIATAAQPRASTAPASHVQYVASKVRFPFHRPGCKWAQRISAKNLQVFETREEAIAAGHRPCKVCQPQGAGSRE